MRGGGRWSCLRCPCRLASHSRTHPQPLPQAEEPPPTTAATSQLVIGTTTQAAAEEAAAAATTEVIAEYLTPDSTHLDSDENENENENVEPLIAQPETTAEGPLINVDTSFLSNSPHYVHVQKKHDIHAINKELKEDAELFKRALEDKFAGFGNAKDDDIPETNGILLPQRYIETRSTCNDGRK